MKTLLICASLILGCGYKDLDRCQGPWVEATFNSVGECTYEVHALSDCAYAEVRSMVDLGQDTCMNEGYECEDVFWTASPGSRTTVVKGTCKSE